ncbi:aminoacyl-tRNA editing [Ascochyta rabiei]|uniref:Aminoacyl-tRNA editing n=1 Tax=Didymella rabiei TaxID=5454 RepID=A0A163G263_DIDRA|nr:aminoacyl-tRNA editing [Ascochyta rabiei]
MKLAFARLARARAPCIRSVRTFSTTATRFQSPVHSIPYTESCPAPTCACASTPADLDIDRKTPLLNTMAPYAEQVLICTGKEDWTSKLEDEGGATGEFVKGLKGVIGKGGPAFDVCSPPPISEFCLKRRSSATKSKQGGKRGRSRENKK